MLSEKEMEYIISAAFGVLCPERVTLVAAKDAAHAIAEKMRAGVLWEGEAVADHNDYSALRVEHTVLRIMGHGAVAIRDKHFCDDGQRVRVIVVNDEPLGTHREHSLRAVQLVQPRMAA